MNTIVLAPNQDQMFSLFGALTDEQLISKYLAHVHSEPADDEKRKRWIEARVELGAEIGFRGLLFPQE